MHFNHAANEKFQRVSNAIAAGTSTQSPTPIDVSGAEEVTFVTALGTITATGTPSVHIVEGDDTTAMTAVGSSTVTAADDDDNQLIVNSLVRPTKKYAGVVITRPTANAVVDGVIAILRMIHRAPVGDDTVTVVGKVTKVSA